MKNKISKALSIVLSTLVILTGVISLPTVALADTAGDLGTGVHWNYNEATKTLSFTGSGEIPFYKNQPSIPWWAFRSEIETVSISEGITKINSIVKLSKIKTITLPSTVTDIESSAFYYCTALETVNLSKNINFISNVAFLGCSSLRNFTIDESLNGHGNEFVGNGGGYLMRGSGQGYYVKNGILFSNYDEYLNNIKTNHNRLEIYPYGREDKTYHVPSNTAIIAEKAFASVKHLQTVVLPASTQYIFNHSFWGLGEPYEQPLTVVFQHNNLPKSIGYSAFRNLTEGSKIIVKNEDVKAEFEAEAPNFIYNSSGESTVTIEAQETPTTSLSLSSTELSLKINDTTTIEAAQTPCTTTDNLVFSSSDESVVAFDKHGFGRLTAKGVGTAVVTVTSGSVSKQCSVAVYCEHENTFFSKLQDATCTDDGYTGDESCSICNTVLRFGERIPANGHDYEDWGNAPATCLNYGIFNQKICITCGEISSGTRIPPTNHNGTCEWILIKSPSLYEKGERAYRCIACGIVLKRESIPKLDETIATSCTHASVVKTSKKATYFKEGFTNRLTCVDCGKIINNGSKQKKLKLNKPKVNIKVFGKKIRIKYKKVKDANRFQARYKIKGKWKYKVFKSKKGVTKYIKNLKKGKYKVQVRAMLKKGKNKAYSKWTKTKKVTIK